MKKATPGKRLLIPLVLSIILSSQSVLASPANPEPFEVSQPDGTTFMARQQGDERCHWTETEDGYIVEGDPVTGWWYYTVADEYVGLVPSPYPVGKVDPQVVGIRRGFCMALPTTAHVFSYLPTLPGEYWRFGSDECGFAPSQSKPINVDLLDPGYLSLYLSRFTGPVDAYFAVFAPSISPEIWFLTPEGTLQRHLKHLVKWRDNTTEQTNVYFSFPAGPFLPRGDYYFYLAVTPTGRTDSFYVWSTVFTK